MRSTRHPHVPLTNFNMYHVIWLRLLIASQGGVDQNCPVLVSRVAPNTPAGNSSPKLNEGDQVVAINGQDVSNLSHKQIVDLIRSTTEQDPPELTLTIKPLCMCQFLIFLFLSLTLFFGYLRSNLCVSLLFIRAL